MAIYSHPYVHKREILLTDGYDMSERTRGNSKSIFVMHGASNHSNEERAELDYYATDPDAVRKILDRESFSGTILEPACGGGHICDALEEYGFNVVSFDIANRYARQSDMCDFLSYEPDGGKNCMDIITNPPYSEGMEFVKHAIDISEDRVKIAMFLKLTFLEGKKRKELFAEHPPKTVYVFTNRIDCWKNGVKPDKPSKAVCYAWFVWEKGFKGDPVIKWID